LPGGSWRFELRSQTLAIDAARNDSYVGTRSAYSSNKLRRVAAHGKDGVGFVQNCATQPIVSLLRPAEAGKGRVANLGGMSGYGIVRE
jgi:hypothetical protein